MTHSIFITGTDTGVGKTRIAAALIHSLASRGLKVAGMKPVASGSLMTPQGLRNEDALALIAQSNVTATYTEVNPYCFEPAIAPHIAASEAGAHIDMNVLRDAHARLASRADAVVIEGAGGWLTPLDERTTLADFARLTDSRIVLVVGLRLGCINHALLTAQAVNGLAGWVANTLDPAIPRLEENIRTLAARLAAPALGVIPHDDALDAAATASLLPRLASLVPSGIES